MDPTKKIHTMSKGKGEVSARLLTYIPPNIILINIIAKSLFIMLIKT